MLIKVSFSGITLRFKKSTLVSIIPPVLCDEPYCPARYHSLQNTVGINPITDIHEEVQFGLNIHDLPQKPIYISTTIIIVKIVCRHRLL
jgi:hypothetical protein